MPGEGARLVAEANAGLAVPAEDYLMLTKAVLKLHDMAESEREQMGRNGQAFFRAHFDHEHLVDQLIDRLRLLSHQPGSLR